MRGLHIGIALAAAAAIAAPAFVVAQEGGPADGTLVASAGWRDVVDGQRAPQVPPAGDTESAIILLDGPGLVDVPEADRPAALSTMQADQLAVEGSLQGMGGVVTHRYRTLVNGLAVRLPSGRLSTAAEIPGIQAVVPVLFMSPAQSQPGLPLPTADSPVPGTGAEPPRVTTAPTTPTPAPPTPTPAPTTPTPAPASQPAPPATPTPAPPQGPKHIALIDSAVDAAHPWLGGGIGPANLIIAGSDLVEGDADPSPDPNDPSGESHGTQMASIILRSPALAGLPAGVMPRMLVYRVTAREMVDGRVRTLARTDRVLAALEIAMDPNRDGAPEDAADVVVMGVARGFGAGGVDPVARAMAAADRAGAVVVAPAGNDGPTGGVPGTLGNAAALKDVLVVGGMAGGTAPRTADLTMSIGPAAARMSPLPLMGAEPSNSLKAGLRLVPASGDAGVGSGTDIRDFAGEGGRSIVAGAVAMVTRSGTPLAEVARRAAGAGALGLVVWDEDGTGAFPGIVGGADLPIPIVGLGPTQGRAVMDMLARDPSASVSVVPRADQGATAAVASFSSRGPTADGRLKPDLVAPAIAVEAAYPGRDESGQPRQAPLSGTSAATASVAATALRLRVDHPSWRPEDIRSVLVQS
ncbi:MAG: S8 family serine peptidase, partial [Actinomycetota bacterium]